MIGSPSISRRRASLIRVWFLMDRAIKAWISVEFEKQRELMKVTKHFIGDYTRVGVKRVRHAVIYWLVIYFLGDQVLSVQYSRQIKRWLLTDPIKY